MVGPPSPDGRAILPPGADAPPPPVGRSSPDGRTSLPGRSDRVVKPGRAIPPRWVGPFTGLRLNSSPVGRSHPPSLVGFASVRNPGFLPGWSDDFLPRWSVVSRDHDSSRLAVKGLRFSYNGSAHSPGPVDGWLETTSELGGPDLLPRPPSLVGYGPPCRVFEPTDATGSRKTVRGRGWRLASLPRR